MSELWSAVLVFALLCGTAGLGCYIRPRRPEPHRASETFQPMQVMIAMLVTFAALVLGLLTASAKTTYDRAAVDRQDYALELTQLDQCLRNIGPEGDAARSILGRYTASVVATTWPGEPRPTGIEYPDMTGIPRTGASPVLRILMNQIEIELRHMDHLDRFQEGVRQDCLAVYRNVTRARLAVIESVSGRISVPFHNVLVFWLMIIFATLGLVAPRNSLSLIGIVLSAISLSSALFVIADLSRPYGGLFSISSQDMRTALTQMMAPGP